MNFLKYLYQPFLLLLLLPTTQGCKKFVEVSPPEDQLVNPLPFENDATATAVIIGIYSEMMNGSQLFSSGATTLYAGLSADELLYYTPGMRDEFSANQISQTNHSTINTLFWQPAYRFIYAANMAIEQLTASTKLTPTVRAGLLGEAKFIRAFCYFHLVNLFGDVPLILTSDYRTNQQLARTNAPDVYQQIVSDLLDAKGALPAAYPSPDKCRPNKWAVAALLSRTYLYLGKWDVAEREATTVIDSGGYALPANPAQVFLKNSTETIWQLQPVVTNLNTYEGNSILPGSATDVPKYLLLPTILAEFETGDTRKTTWVASRSYNNQTVHYPYKYKIYNGSALNEFYVVLRLAETILIRAEARAQQLNFSGALIDLNKIRSRASLPAISLTAQSQLLEAIGKERRIELLSEWGHRWYDLKRTGRAAPVLGALKTATWQSTDTLWPIPFQQLQLNPTLTQNPGY